ncbi:RNA-directed DNA polymerase, eukaryota [Tanacetum coccineum]
MVRPVRARNEVRCHYRALTAGRRRMDTSDESQNTFGCPESVWSLGCVWDVDAVRQRVRGERWLWVLRISRVGRVGGMSHIDRGMEAGTVQSKSEAEGYNGGLRDLCGRMGWGRGRWEEACLRGKMGWILRTHGELPQAMECLKKDFEKKDLGVDLFSLKSMEREKGVHAHTQNHHDNQNGEGWTTVRRRSLKTTSQQSDIILYFFTNIPSGLNETILWKAFVKHGMISDVYMVKKTTVNRRRFVFTRFLNIDDPTSFEKILNTVTFNNQHLVGMW